MSGPTGNVWAFADGSKPSGTDAYTWVFPDMRGQFIRGVNMGLTGSYSDPDAASRIGGDINDAGSTQDDAFQGHLPSWYNQYSSWESGHGAAGTSGSANSTNNLAIGGLTLVADATNGAPRISSETRPANIAVYWYIKVR